MEFSVLGVNMPSKQSKIRGMFLGVAIGDQLGRCAEGMTPAQIKKNYGRVINYRRPVNRRWKNKKAKVWTDDNQLHLATAKGMIRAGKFDMASIAKEHIKAYNESTEGWGGSTREAVERLKSGVRWTDSGKTNKKDRGHGNGVVMKIGSLALHNILINASSADLYEKIIEFTLMTHYSFPALAGSVSHVIGLEYCLNNNIDDFAPIDMLHQIYLELNHLPFLTQMWNHSELVPSSYKRSYWWETSNGQIEREAPVELNMHKLLSFPAMKIQHARAAFGRGDCLVYHSLPFAYYFFMRWASSFESVIRVINAGGDTDTTGSIVGALLGALHGEDIFPKHLIRNLQDPELVIDTADRFYKTFA